MKIAFFIHADTKSQLEIIHTCDNKKSIPARTNQQKSCIYSVPKHCFIDSENSKYYFYAMEKTLWRKFIEM